MQLPYHVYLDKILGGWIGKCMGGAIGTRFEGHKGWIDIKPEEMFPDKMPPNDDLDLQVLWLKVLEERGPALTSDHLAAAWLEDCWYPFNEYGIFRRNWNLGIHAPESGRYANQFWETGEGCPIRAEIWGYVFPGAPELAAAFAEKDGTLDHTEQSVGAEKMLAAMASMAFFVDDVRKLARMYFHYLPEGSRIQRLSREAFACYDAGLSLRDARDRLMLLAGVPEACDAQINIPFTFLGLLYGGNDLTSISLSALACGYDTDCTIASAAALMGQILGASRIADSLKKSVGEELVMGIKYRRDEMTISALARDTARVGVLLSRAMATGTSISDAPALAPFPPTAVAPKTSLRTTYGVPSGAMAASIAQANASLPAAGPGDSLQVTLHIEGHLPEPAALSLAGPKAWTIAPASLTLTPGQRSATFTLHAPAAVPLPHKNLFTATLNNSTTHTFGVAGAGVYYFLGAFYDAVPPANDPFANDRKMNHHFVNPHAAYLPLENLDLRAQFEKVSRILGRPAILRSYEHEIDVSQLTGLQGAYVAYVARIIDCPSERPIHFSIGNTDGFAVYVNGEKLVEEANEHVAWAPFNWHPKATFKKGRNVIVIKLLKRGDSIRFTLAFRDAVQHTWFNCADYVTDLAEAPL